MIRARLRAIMLAPRKLTVLHLTDVILVPRVSSPLFTASAAAALRK